MDMEIFKKTRNLSCTKWSEKWVVRLNSMDERALLAYECFFYDFSIMSYSINHPASHM